MMPMFFSLSLLLLLLLVLDPNNKTVSSTPAPLSPSAISINRKVTSRLSSNHETVSSHSSKSLFLAAQILRDIRGGGRGAYDEDYEDNDSYDEYDSDEEDREENFLQRESEGKRRGSNNSVRDPYRNGSRAGYNPSNRQRGPRGKGGSPSSTRSSSSATNAASAATKLATKSLSITGSLAWNALVKTPGKLAFHVIRPKHVDLVETFGLWRLDQQIVERANRQRDDQRTITSVATIEFIPASQPPRREKERPRRGSDRGPRSYQRRPPLVVVRHSKSERKDTEDDDEKDFVYRAPYTFIRKNKYLKGASLSSFQTSFVAPAFLVGENQTRLYGYKGTWQRKLADKSVIKLKGKIYQVHKQKFGKKRGEYVYGPAVGTFVMRRRISMPEEEYDESDDGEFDYDGDGDYDDDIEEYSEIEGEEWR